jgi:hypothetical protein
MGELLFPDPDIVLGIKKPAGEMMFPDPDVVLGKKTAPEEVLFPDPDVVLGRKPAPTEVLFPDPDVVLNRVHAAQPAIKADATYDLAESNLKKMNELSILGSGATKSKIADMANDPSFNTILKQELPGRTIPGRRIVPVTQPTSVENTLNAFAGRLAGGFPDPDIILGMGGAKEAATGSSAIKEAGTKWGGDPKGPITPPIPTAAQQEKGGPVQSPKKYDLAVVGHPHTEFNQEIKRTKAPDEPGVHGIMGGIGALLGSPFRFIGGASQGLHDLAQYKGKYLDWTENHAEEPKGFVRQALESTAAPFLGEQKGVQEKDKYKEVYLGDVYGHALKDVIARDLTPAENTATQVLGFLSEVGLSPYMFPAKGGVPSAKALPIQIEKAANKLGMEGWSADPARIADILSKESKVERVSAAMQYGKEIATANKIAPAAFDDMLKRVFGPRASRFGEAGWGIGSNKVWGGKKSLYPVSREVPEVGMAGKFGAEAPAMVPGAKAVAFRAGLPEDTLDAYRQAHAAKNAMTEEGMNVAQGVQKSLGTERSKDLGRLMDTQTAETRLARFAEEVNKKLDMLEKSKPLEDLLSTPFPEELGKDILNVTKKISGDPATNKEYTAYFKELNEQLKIKRGIKNKLDVVKKFNEEQVARREGLIKDLDEATKGFGEVAQKNMTPYFNQPNGLIDRIHKAISKTYQDEIIVPSVEDALGKYKEMRAAMTPEMKQAETEIRALVDSSYQQAVKAGVQVDYLKDYFPRIETEASRKLHPDMQGTVFGGSGGEVSGHGAHRMDLKYGVGLKNEGREFIESASEASARFSVASATATANAQLENKIMSSVGRELNQGVDYFAEKIAKEGGKAGEFTERYHLSPEMEAMAKGKGMVLYDPKMGAFKGRHFLVDQQSKALLDRAASPEEFNRFQKAAMAVTKSFKSGATVWWPGFVFRNFMLGNLYNEWLRDVDIVSSHGLAFRLQSYNAAKSGSVIGQVAARKLGGIGKTIQGTEKIFGNWTYDAAMNEAKKYGLFGNQSFSVEELGQGGFSKAATTYGNPFSSNFIVPKTIGAANSFLESNSKLAVFLDGLKKGFTPQQAAKNVAETIFNYDEVTKGMKTLSRYNIVPFATWPSKNIGLQLETLYHNSRKAALTGEFIRTSGKIDPLTQDQAERERVMPDIMKAFQFRVPRPEAALVGMKDDSERGYIPLSNTIPLFSAASFLDVTDIKRTARVIGDSLGYPIKIALEQAGAAPTVGTFGHLGVPFVSSEYATQRAPTWLNKFFMWLDKEHPEAASLMEKVGVVYPNRNILETMPKWKEKRAEGVPVGQIREQVDKEVPVSGVSVPAWMTYLLSNLHPGLNRVSKVIDKIASPAQDETGYDIFVNIFTGMKPFLLSKERATNFNIDQQNQLRETLGDIKKREKKSGSYPKTDEPEMLRQIEYQWKNKQNQ